MKFYSVMSSIYTVISFITLVHFLTTSAAGSLVLTILSAIWSAEAGITAKIIEHKPKEVVE